MILFDLDGCLANCEHRRHLIDPEKYLQLCEYSNYYINESGDPIIDLEGKASWRYKKSGKPFQHGWPAFYAACDKDEPIQPTIDILNLLLEHFNMQIWSGRCESVRAKTNYWLVKHGITDLEILKNLKMRPIGDNTPDDVLKERWLDEYYHSTVVKNQIEGKSPTGSIDFVFDSDPKSIAMYRRRGIFVFNCAQSDG